MTAYRLGDLVLDRADDGIWAAPLPTGPIMLLQGISPVILELVAEAPDPVTAGEVLERLVELVDDAPEDAQALVAAHLAELCAHGVLEAVEDDAAVPDGAPGSDETPGSGEAPERGRA